METPQNHQQTLMKIEMSSVRMFTFFRKFSQTKLIKLIVLGCIFLFPHNQDLLIWLNEITNKYGNAVLRRRYFIPNVYLFINIAIIEILYRTQWRLPSAVKFSSRELL